MTPSVEKHCMKGYWNGIQIGETLPISTVYLDCVDGLGDTNLANFDSVDDLCSLVATTVLLVTMNADEIKQNVLIATRPQI